VVATTTTNIIVIINDVAHLKTCTKFLRDKGHDLFTSV
jgi:hypothetical protein